MNQADWARRQPDNINPDILLSPLKLLIIEDVPEDVELIVLTLESANLDFTYDTTSTPEECRQWLSSCHYDVVLSDYRLPNFTGWQVFDLLQASGQDIPFILITGSLGEEAAVECIKTGMTDYVLKDRLFRLPTVVARALQEFDLRRQQRAAITQIRQQAWRETIVNQIIQAMRETLVLEEVLQTTVDQLQEALQVSRCGIWQPATDQTSELTIQYLSQATPHREQLLGIACSFCNYYQKQFANDQPVVIHEIGPDLPDPARAIAQSYGIQSAILMPLVYQQSNLGGIFLHQCDGQRIWTEDEVALVRAIADQCAIAIHQVQLYQQAQTELAERQRIEAQLRHDAFHDALTGLPNRALLMNRLEHALALAQRRLQRKPFNLSPRFAILFLDLDRFKVINDSLGHTAGDQLLKTVAQQLQSCLRIGDMVARLGGDEFVILLEDIQSASNAIEAANRIHQGLEAPIFLDGHEIVITASVGIALYSPYYTEPDQLLRDADTAMYRAKKVSLGSYEIFNTSMHTFALRQLQLESDLRRAIERHELRIYYQPIIALATHRIEGLEALVRWLHPEYGIISPGEFIPIAEETGLIAQIDLWVLQEACRQLRFWKQEFSLLPDLAISVNLSGKQFSHDELITRIDQALHGSGISGSWLKVEITEGVLIENPHVAADTLKQLRARQIKVCLDDFGTGYSSLSYLHRFPIDVLKIDRSFITSLETDPGKVEIVKAIVNLALNLGLSVVAEGVETSRQLSYLESIQCHSGQGYYFAQPLDSAAASELLRQHPLQLNPSSH